MVTEIAGFNETAAAALFADQAEFMLGCQFASLVMDTFLAGVLAMQIHKYFSHQSDDKRWTRMIVAWCAIMNSIVTVYYWVYISYLFVKRFGQWLPWLEVRWLMLMPTFDGMCVVVVQGFFGYRAFLLMKRNWFLLITIWVLLLVALGGAIGVTVIFGRQESLLGATACGPPLIAWTATTTAADVLIAVSIMYGLIKNKTGWAHTDRLVTRYIRMTFEAQLPPTLLSIGYLAEWSVQPDSLLGAVFQALQCKAYTVGLLFALNSRVDYTSLRNDTHAGVPQVFGMTSRRATDHIQVDVHTETFIDASLHSVDGMQGVYDGNAKRGVSLSDAELGGKENIDNVSTTRLTNPVVNYD